LSCRALQAVPAAHPLSTCSSREPLTLARNYLAWLLAFLALLLIARLASLFFGRTDFFFDEAQYWVWSRDLEFGYFSKPPLIAWIIRVSTEICGDAEWCVRAPSPILYTFTPIFIFLAARAFYDERIAFWSAVGLATLPGISLSSLIISTDVPLLLCWSVAFFGWVRLVESRRLSYAVLVGAALGIGLLAKYAALYFVLCIGVDALTDRRAREALQGGRAFVIALFALALVAPNLLWNATHGFATFSHTAANANWSGPSIHPDSALEFIASQLGVFGPILFPALAVIAYRVWRGGCEQPACRLLAFSIPVLLLLIVQALLSRAHANWAAVAYPAATILVTASLLRHRPRLFRFSFGLHVAAAMLITIGPLLAPRLTLAGASSRKPASISPRSVAREPFLPIRGK
jgi:4-amino-4-deoxy-L-arabinose transferase-like glycosyltransferase